MEEHTLSCRRENHVFEWSSRNQTCSIRIKKFGRTQLEVANLSQDEEGLNLTEDLTVFVKEVIELLTLVYQVLRQPEPDLDFASSLLRASTKELSFLNLTENRDLQAATTVILQDLLKLEVPIYTLHSLEQLYRLFIRPVLRSLKYLTWLTSIFTRLIWQASQEDLELVTRELLASFNLSEEFIANVRNKRREWIPRRLN